MNRLLRLPVVLALLLVALYGVRAGIGVYKGRSMSLGYRWADKGWHVDAIEKLERGTFGGRAATTLWLRGEVRQGIWQMRYGVDPPEELDAVLVAGHADFTRAIALSPAAGWSWTGLADLYELQEEGERVRAAVDLELLGGDPWLAVGRPGRIAIGMARRAIEQQPTNFNFYDALADLLRDLDLDELALDVIRQSAALQPISYLHDLEPVTPEVLDAFAEGAREALQKTPFLSEGRHLTALGIVENRRRNWAQAEADLRASLELPGHRLHMAETRYHLAVAVHEQGRPTEALEILELAREHPNMERVSLMRKALILEQSERVEEALVVLRDLRRIEPRNLGYILEFARVATALGHEKPALEALRWGVLIHSANPRPLIPLIELHLQRGERTQARERLDQLERIVGTTGQVEALRRRLQAGNADDRSPG